MFKGEESIKISKDIHWWWVGKYHSIISGKKKEGGLSGRVMRSSNICIPHPALCHPVNALHHPIPCQARGGEGHHLPCPHQVQVGLEQWLYFTHSHAIDKVLLVGGYQQGDTSHILVLDHRVESFFGLFDSFPVTRVDHINNCVTLLQHKQ